MEKSRGTERTRAANVLLRLRAQLGLDAKRRQPRDATPDVDAYLAEAAEEVARREAAEAAQADEDEAGA